MLYAMLASVIAALARTMPMVLIGPDPENWSDWSASFSGTVNPKEGSCHETEAVYG